MWRISVVLVSALVLLSRAEQLRYTKNSVYYASMGGFPTQSTLDRDESSKEVLKELGVDLSNEGKKKFSISQKYFKAENSRNNFLWFQQLFKTRFFVSREKWPLIEL